jgi:hypothetical protein
MTSATASDRRRSAATVSGTIRSRGATTSRLAIEPVRSGGLRNDSVGEKENVVAST